MVKRLTKACRRAGQKSLRRVSRLSTRLRSRFEQIRYRRQANVVLIDRAVARFGHVRRPDFIIIGAPKCGTSWLQRALAQHPGILMVPDEIEYFSAHLDYSVEWYFNHFARAAKRGPSDALIGEKSANYCSIPLHRIRLVHRFLPDAKLILMTRDPVQRAWSQAKRFFSKRRFNPDERGVLAVPPEVLFDYFERTRSLGQFSTMIASWCEVYPRRQLLVLAQESSIADPQTTYDLALDHIGAARDYDSAAISLLQAETNLGPKIAMPDNVAEHLEAMFASERERLHALLKDHASNRRRERP